MPPMRGPSSASTAGSSSATTAAIYEFTCLFTHDLRRKQKRWEDGRLRYHTFNKRVMVYDERGHFIGDTHWQHDWDFGEGEEFPLDRGAVIVQVSECVGRQEQDLSELLDRRTKGKEDRQPRTVARPVPSSGVSTTSPPGARANDNLQSRHRPLSQLLTPTGHHGRAVVPSESPFELRQRAADGDRTNEPPPKRRKHEDTKPAFAQHLFGATLTLSATPLSSAPIPKAAPSIYRQQQTSSPADAGCPSEEEPQAPGMGLPAAGFSVSGGLSGPSETPARPDRVSIEDRRPSANASSVPVRLPAKRTAATLLKSVPRVLDEATDHSNDPQAAAAPQTAVKPTKFSSRLETAEEPVARGAQSKARIPEQNAAARPSVADPGTSLSLAIVVDEDGHDENRDPQDSSYGRQNVTKVVRPKSKVVKEPKQKPKGDRPGEPLASLRSRDRDRQASPQHEEAEEPPPEERRELRLKPRPKRGLLCLAEGKIKTKQTNRRTATTEPKTRDVVPRPAVKTSDHGEDIFTAAAEDVLELPQPSPKLADEAGRNVASAPSPAAALNDEAIERRMPEMPEIPEPEPPRLASDDVNDAPLDIEVTECRMSDLDDMPSLPKPKSNGPKKTRDVFEPSSSPPARRGRSKHRVPAKANPDLSESSSSEPEQPPEEETVEAAPSSSPPRSRAKRNLRERHLAGKKTRKTGSSSESESLEDAAEEQELPESPPKTRARRNLREQQPARKRVRIADSNDSDEDVPPPPPRPKLARLSKSVRSREVIGFIPSSPPVVNYNSLARAPVDVEASDLAKDVEPPPQPSDGMQQQRNEDRLSEKDGPMTSRTNVAPRDSLPVDGQVQHPPDKELMVQHEGLRRPSNPPKRDSFTSRQAVDGDDHRIESPIRTVQGPQSVITETTTAPSIRTGNLAQNRAFGAGIKSLPSSTASASSPHDSPNLQKPLARLTNGAADIASDGSAAKRLENGQKAPPQPAPPPVPAVASSAAPISDPFPRAPIATTRPASVTATTVTGISSTANAEAADPVPPAPAPAAPARPRIANPATRGRKAALKSDAKGLVPIPVIPVLPPDPVGPTARMGLGMGMGMGSMGGMGGMGGGVGGGLAPPPPAREERPKRVMRFPGFASARNGGPWSREAHDLLEKGRPG
ncbi:hypothetical protein VTJ83DRAFT_1541 [Remersonia thermophila]|uniref:5'-3' DNA helicase ZGRF1-like N-terminal domain-containing protein n=1 Tax=Remersonia thermophila TaxID=72144 RepID=A0ABR4DIH6_9PEZI